MKSICRRPRKSRKSRKGRKSSKRYSKKRLNLKGGACTNDADPISLENFVASVPLAYRISIPTGVQNLENCFDIRQLFAWLSNYRYDADDNPIFINPLTNAPFTDIQLQALVTGHFDGRGYGAVLELIRVKLGQDTLVKNRIFLLQEHNYKNFFLWNQRSLSKMGGFPLSRFLTSMLDALDFHVPSKLCEQISTDLTGSFQRINTDENIDNYFQMEVVVPQNEQEFSATLINNHALDADATSAADAFLVKLPFIAQYFIYLPQGREVISKFVTNFLGTGSSSVLTYRMMRTIFSDMVPDIKILKLVRAFMILSTPEVLQFCLGMI